MSLKYSSTTADYLQWSEAMNLVRKLARDSNYKTVSYTHLFGYPFLQLVKTGPGNR